MSWFRYIGRVAAGALPLVAAACSLGIAVVRAADFYQSTFAATRTPRCHPRYYRIPENHCRLARCPWQRNTGTTSSDGGSGGGCSTDPTAVQC
jgi:hypothetical protein